MRIPSLRRAAALAAALLALPPSLAAQQPDTAWAPYTAPPTVSAVGHRLNARLAAAPGRVTLDGQSLPTNLFNGLLTPPVLELEPGDSLNLWLVNGMTGATDTTNLHYHGFAVSPEPPADNVTMIHVAPGDSFKYSMRLPGDHQQGLFWYHPHPHGVSAGQVGGGMAGLISIGDPRAGFGRPIQNAPEFYLMLKQFEIDEPSVSIPLVNGHRRVQLPDVVVGGRQFWRIANTAADRYFSLRVTGPDGRNAKFQTIARDGNPVPQGVLVEEDSMLLGPGQRAEIIVRALLPGNYVLRAVDFKRNSSSVDSGGVLARARAVLVTEAERPAALSRAGQAGGDADEEAVIRLLRAPPEAVHHDSIEFEVIPRSGQLPRFTIDSLEYNPAVVNKTIRLGETYEWKIKNPSSSWHVFHIHQTDFLVLSIGGEKMPPRYRVDTVNVPPNSNSVIRFTYDRPETVGPFVYHCHLLFHEDKGMMANITLLPADGAATASTGGGHSH